MNFAQQEQISQQDFENNRRIQLAKAVDTIIEALKEDKEYYEGWKSNIAVSFMNSYESYLHNEDGSPRDSFPDNWMHEVSNKAAESFLNLLINQAQLK